MWRSLLVGAAVVTSACVNTKATVLDPSIHPQRFCAEGVKVYLTEDDVKADFTNIALLKSKGDDDLTSETGMINSQRKKAAELGANGLILGERKDASTGAKVAHAFLGTSKNRKGEAVAILVPSDTARAYTMCGGMASH